MDSRKITLFRKIFDKTIGQVIEERKIFECIEKRYLQEFDIPENEFVKYYTGEKIPRVTFFLKKNNDTYVPVMSHSKGSIQTVSVYSILKLGKFTSTPTHNKKDYSIPKLSTLTKICYVLGYHLSQEEIKILQDYDINESFSEYLRTLGISNTREDVFAKIIDYLNHPSYNLLTICTNDLHFAPYIIPSIVVFISKGGKLNLFFDPSSIDDIITSKLIILQRIGVSITLLPLKKRYFTYGLFPNWDISSKDLPSSIFTFKTYFFDRNSHNRGYSEIVSDPIDIKRIVSEFITINTHKSKSENFALVVLKSYKINLTQLTKEEYIKFLYTKYKMATHKEKNILNPYANASFDFEEIDIESVYRRSNRVPLYKLIQNYHFISHFKTSIISFKDNTIVDFIPYNVEIAKNYIYPINPVIIEYNHINNRYEVSEGHCRIWLLYNVYGIKKINTIVVRNINPDYLRLNRETQDSSLDSNWHVSTFKTSSIDEIDKETLLLKFRFIETQTHILDKELYALFCKELIENGIITENDISLSRNINF